MSDVESTGLAIVAGAMNGLPAPVNTSFIKALNDLLGGLTAIPAAKLKQYAQGIEDITVARSAVSAMVAKGTGEGVLADPLLMQAAAEIYLPTVLRKAKNRIAVAQKAAEYIADEAGEHPNASPPGDDWMNYYARFAEDASSENLQVLFGRILAGQIVRPGSFSQRTIRFVAELDQAIAADFSLAWAKSVGGSVDHSVEFQRGDWFDRWQRLAEVGLLASRHSIRFLPSFNPIANGYGLWTPFAAGDTFVAIQFPKDCGAQWAHIDFTQVGRELGSILPRPDYEANMRLASQKLANQNVAQIVLHSAGKPPELLYEAPSMAAG